jgi:hypothetical protein
MGDERNEYKILVRNLNESESFEHLFVAVKMILIRVLEKLNVRLWVGFICLRIMATVMNIRVP